MFNLIMKDIRIQKHILGFALINSLITIFAFQKPPFSTLLYALGAMIIVIVAVVTGTAYDEKSSMVLCSLPVSRREIVLAKYYSAFIFAAADLLLTTLMGIMLRLGLTVRPITIWDIIGAMTGTVLFCSYYLPLHFKFGSIRNNYSILFYPVLFFIPFILVEYSKPHLRGALFLLSEIRYAPVWLVWSVVTTALLALLLLSLTASILFYEHKDI